jgi:methylisocitrate lyase
MNPLRSRLHTARGLQFVGVPSVLCARLIERAGYDGLYVSGAVLSQFVHGMADDGSLTLAQVRDFAAEICAATPLPVIVDADTGFGEGADGTDVSRCVRELGAAGVAAIQIEDQVEAKLCGHLDGKQLVSPEAMCAKLRSAVAARGADGPVLIARTDARGVTGWDDALARARAYCAAGAEMIFIEALPTAEEFQAFAEACPGPLLANMTEFGKSPLLERERLAAFGYTAIIYPGLLMRSMLAVAEEALAHLKAHGQQRALLPRMFTRQRLYDLIAYDHAVPQSPDAAD